jgi:hypothetical protein
MIRIITNLRNGEALRMTIEATGDKLPAYCKSNRDAACWLIDSGVAAADEIVTFRNAGLDYDSFKPYTVGRWARGNKLFGQAKPASAHVADLQKRQSLPSRPHKGTLCAAVWELMDELGLGASNAQVIEIGTSRGLNPGNVRVEASKWRKAQALRAARS